MKNLENFLLAHLDLLLKILFLFICVYLCEHMPWMWGYPRRLEENVVCPGADMTGSFELSDMSAGN